MSFSATSRAERIEAAAAALLVGWWNYEIKTYTAEGQRLLNDLRAAVQTDIAPPKPPVGASSDLTPRGRSDV